MRACKIEQELFCELPDNATDSALRQTTATLLTYVELSLFIPQLRALKTIGLNL